MKSSDKTFFVLAFISIRPIKIAQTAWNTLLLFLFLFEFGCEKIASEGDCFCFSSDFGPKSTPSCYRIANASGQAA